MKTTKEQARIYLDIISTQKEAIHMHENDIESAIGVHVDCDAGVFRTMWSFLDRYIDLTAEQTGIDMHALNWFVFENNCGKNKMSSAWPGKEMRVIDSIDAFLDFQYENE